MSGVFTFSVDVEGLWGLFFVRSYVEDPRVAQAGRDGLVRLAQMLADRDMPSTFAFVGHLFLDSCGPWNGGPPHPDMPRPAYPWYDRDWYADDPGTDEVRDPLWYEPGHARELAGMGHEIGAHGFAHVILDEDCVGRDVADGEFRGAQTAAADLGLDALGSYVFPQNVVGHVDGLAAAGYRCYREPDGGVAARAGPPGGFGRARNLLKHALAATPPVGRPRVREDGVVALPSSLPFLGREGIRNVVSRSARVARIDKGLERAAREDAVLHLWTHPHQFAAQPNFDDLEAVLDRVAAVRDRGDVEVLTMGALADRALENAGA